MEVFSNLYLNRSYITFKHGYGWLTKFSFEKKKYYYHLLFILYVLITEIKERERRRMKFPLEILIISFLFTAAHECRGIFRQHHRGALVIKENSSTYTEMK